MSSVKPRNGNGSKRRPRIPYIGKPSTEAEFYAEYGITKRDIAEIDKILAEVRERKARRDARKKAALKKARAAR